MEEGPPCLRRAPITQVAAHANRLMPQRVTLAGLLDVLQQRNGAVGRPTQVKTGRIGTPVQPDAFEAIDVVISRRWPRQSHAFRLATRSQALYSATGVAGLDRCSLVIRRHRVSVGCEQRLGQRLARCAVTEISAEAVTLEQSV